MVDKKILTIYNANYIKTIRRKINDKRKDICSKCFRESEEAK